MNQSYFFGQAKWVGAPNRTAEHFSVLRGRFFASNPKRVTLDVLGLGFFKCYINGVCINPDTFLPLSSDYEASCDPKEEILSGHRVYVPSFDITSLVREGENVIAMQYGGGWYTSNCRTFGLPKAIYRIAVEGEQTEFFFSDENCRIGEGFVNGYRLVSHERHSYPDWEDCFSPDFDDCKWEHALPVEAPETEYCRTDCPKDALIEELAVKRIGEGGKIVFPGERCYAFPESGGTDDG